MSCDSTLGLKILSDILSDNILYSQIFLLEPTQDKKSDII